MASSSHYRASPAPPSSFSTRPNSRRTASSYDVRPYIGHHHRTPSSSTVLPFARAHPMTSPQPVVPDPRFSRLFTTVLGSPFLTTSDASPFDVESIDLNPRPPSPTPTADFSIIDVDPQDSEPNPLSIPGGYPTNKSIPSLAVPQSTSSNSLKSLLPRLWDALSSPGRTMLNFSPSANAVAISPSSSRSSSRTASPSASPRRYPAHSQSASYGRLSPGYWNTGKAKGKSKAVINYLELPPLDGEEGELIDDEACFIDVRAVTGIDIVSLLPPELALHVLTLVCPTTLSTSVFPNRDPDPHEALKTLLSCRLVSRAWCRLASDNAVWRVLFLGRWNIDLRRTADPGFAANNHARSIRALLGKTWDYDMIDIGSKAKRVLGLSSPTIDAPVTSAPLQLDWRVLYRERFELDMRWAGAARASSSHDDFRYSPYSSSRRMAGIFNAVGTVTGMGLDLEMPNARVAKGYEPKQMKLSGHTDSVYCLEFDSRRIVTGSRDRTIKVWSLQTGKLLGTFPGHHGSVLCLKFEKDWDREWEEEGAEDTQFQSSHRDRRMSIRTARERRRKTGFMVSGSSDCSVIVWDLHLGLLIESDDAVSVFSDDQSVLGRDDGERTVDAEERAVLKGHSGGVLDLRIDAKWIVSCSKDAGIRVWDRNTLELHRTLRGHEGPVNAVGLQTGRVVSASGDGKMILWDIASGERLRTFEGHDRGLACIEFKHDLIVSGSNDCKIKVWSASTGECLRTLVGHEALVRALSFDPRSGRLVSASYDKSVKLWDLGSGKLVREFKGQEGHTSHIFDVKFDVARIVSTSHDQKIVVLDFSAGLNTALFV